MVFPCCSLCGVMIKLFLLASIVAFTQFHGKKRSYTYKDIIRLSEAVVSSKGLGSSWFVLYNSILFTFSWPQYLIYKKISTLRNGNRDYIHHYQYNFLKTL